MRNNMKSSVGKPTHGVSKAGGSGTEVRIKRGGLYVTRTGNSNGLRKRKRQKQNSGVVYVPPVVRPKWARKYALALSDSLAKEGA